MPLPATPKLPAMRRLMRDEAYDRLRELIVKGTLAPGETLRDRDLAAWLGVSRMPVREALARLAEEGLLTIAANRHTRVAPLAAPGVREAHRLIALIEAELVDVSFASTNPEALGGLAERFQWALWRNDADEAIAADQALHSATRGTPPDSIGTQVLRRLDALARRAQRAAWVSLSRAWPIEAHAGLVAGVARHDREAARAAIESEWAALAEMTVEGLSPN